MAYIPFGTSSATANIIWPPPPASGFFTPVLLSYSIYTNHNNNELPPFTCARLNSVYTSRFVRVILAQGPC